MNITFQCQFEHLARVFDPPIPAKELLPEWYRKQPALIEEEMNEKGRFDETVKRCMPVLDAMIAGYIWRFPSDAFFSYNPDGSRSSKWSIEGWTLIESHSREQFSEMSVQPEWDDVALKVVNPWIIRTPPGYSCLFTTPMWRDDLPFMVCQGIVDTDRYVQPINFPFFLRRGFEGVVEDGTPFVQIIPFRREEWLSEVIEEPDVQGQVEWQRASRKSSNRYKSLWRTVKSWR